MTKAKPNPSPKRNDDPPADDTPEANEAHDGIREHLRRIGVVDEETVQRTLDAHEDGIDVEEIITDIKAGMPQWLVILLAIHRKARGKTAPERGAVKKENGEEA